MHTLKIQTTNFYAFAITSHKCTFNTHTSYAHYIYTNTKQQYTTRIQYYIHHTHYIYYTHYTHYTHYTLYIHLQLSILLRDIWYKFTSIINHCFPTISVGLCIVALPWFHFFTSIHHHYTCDAIAVQTLKCKYKQFVYAAYTSMRIWVHESASVVCYVCYVCYVCVVCCE